LENIEKREKWKFVGISDSRRALSVHTKVSVPCLLFLLHFCRVCCWTVDQVYNVIYTVVPHKNVTNTNSAIRTLYNTIGTIPCSNSPRLSIREDIFLSQQSYITQPIFD
jgi:hypothetical protein